MSSAAISYSALRHVRYGSVISRHCGLAAGCPFHPQEQTFSDHSGMSVWCQKRSCALLVLRTADPTCAARTRIRIAGEYGIEDGQKKPWEGCADRPALAMSLLPAPPASG
jgi:hypothetical protein